MENFQKVVVIYKYQFPCQRHLWLAAGNITKKAPAESFAFYHTQLILSTLMETIVLVFSA